MLQKYYQLTKPGIVYGNCMAAAAGFLLASGRHIDFWLLLATLFGMALVIAGSCVANNYIDRGIDEKMARTRKRAIVQGSVSGRAAISYAVALTVIGFLVLGGYVNMLTCLVGITGVVFYVAVYGLAKRTTVYSTLIGSISGSMPLVAGYTAATNRLDGGALLLFLLMTAWQMPHFYAIGIYRLKDYASAGLPIWPIKKGIVSTKRQMALFIAIFIVITLRLSIGGYAGKTYAVVTVALGLWWLQMAIRGRHAPDDAKWARGMFGFSLIVLMGFSLMMAVNAWLP